MSTPGSRSRSRLVAIGSCGTLALAAGLAVSTWGQPVPGPVTRPVPRPNRVASVAGTLTLMVGSTGTEASAAIPPSGRIELPDVDVYLKDAVSGAGGAKKKTQLDGKFHLTAPSAGTYTVCWDAPSIGADCGSRFKVGLDDVFLKVVPVRAPPGVVYGKVLTADDRPCWVSDPFFALDVSTSVILLDSSQKVVQPAVRANTQGEYAFAGLKPDRYRVRGLCEKARGEAAALVGNLPVVANVSLSNHAPRLAGIAAMANGLGISRAAAGATISVEAAVRDQDNDPVEYLWRAADGASAVAATSVGQRSWTLGAAAGVQTQYLVARDGQGGYAYRRFDIAVGGAGVGFSGRVIDEVLQAPVANAIVTVNGTTAKTNANGWFNLTTAVAPAPERYVLNINHPKYALLSRIHDKASAGDVYALIRVQTITVDPANAVDVTDDKSSGPCGGRPARPLKSAGKRPTPSEGDAPACRRAGARLVLPPGVLVDSAQNPASGPVSLQLATLNPARRSLPGDYRATSSANDPVEMLSYGAVYTQFRDSGGRPLNLKAGSAAEIQVPVPVEQLASAKPSIALWSYDEGQGLWREEGTATLTSTAQGPMYIGQTKHFSTLNMDVAGNDPAQATCVRFELGSSLAGWTNLVVRAYVSYGGTAVQVKETPLNGDQYHAIYRIPYAPPAPPPNSVRLELRGTYGGQEVVLLNNVINTDARPKMTGTNLWPPYPYAECGDVVTLQADPVNLPYYGDIDATGRPAFLTGPFGQFLPADGEQVATDYYNTVDPGNATNPTLGAWWTNHGFAADGSGGTRAAYLNNNDLGFGRDMNCKTTGGDLACYVTNYGAPDQNPTNADDAENRVAAKRGATVAMEYKSSEPADRRVRFFVYGGGDPATAGKLKFADLDGLGPKPVPYLCVVCHGGNYDDTAHNAVQARFREFDLQSFKYSGDRSWDYPPAPASNNLTANELTAFATLNQLVRDVQPNTSAIKELINNWYPGGFGAGTKPSNTAVPPGWATNATVYRNVYGMSCRTCHVARDGGVANAYITFNSASNYQTTNYAVCGSPKLMPNAYVTYKNFWSDLQRVIDYKNFTGAATCQ
jgi:hypothetical protein